MVKKQHTEANMTTRVLVRDIMNSPVVTAHKDDTIRDIAIRMKDERVGSIIISENEKPAEL